MRSDCILFDVNETLLDLAPLRGVFETHLGSGASVSTWFARMLHASTVCLVTGVKTDFRRLAQEGLRRTAAEHGRRLFAAAEEELLGTFSRLPAHADVAPALRRLRSSGFRCVAFSNSSTALLQAQMEGAGLQDRLDDLISVESFGSFKPDPAVYRGAARLVQRPVGAVWLVACHDWDCHGAMQAGLQSAWLRRGPAPYGAVYRRPMLQGPNLNELAASLVQKATA